MRNHRRTRVAASLAASVALALAAASPATADGKPLYSKHCAQCHGGDGKGDTPAGRGMKLSPIGGTEESVTVSLVRRHPAHRAASKSLDDEELAAVAATVAGL